MQTTSKKRPPSSVEATASSQKNRGARSRLNMPESVNYNVSIRVSDGVQPNQTLPSALADFVDEQNALTGSLEGSQEATLLTNHD